MPATVDILLPETSGVARTDNHPHWIIRNVVKINAALIKLSISITV